LKVARGRVVTKHMNGKYSGMQSRLFLCPTRRKVNENRTVIFSCINGVKAEAVKKLLLQA
jgi:hypothetical protein